jgi:hypothetical protein
MPIITVREPDPASAFATTGDLAVWWRALDSAETSRAEVLLSAASRMIRRLYADVDARIAAGTLTADDVADVVLAMVQRAMQSGTAGVTQSTESYGPFSKTAQFSGPSGSLYLLDDEAGVFAAVESQRGANWSWLS